MGKDSRQNIFFEIDLNAQHFLVNTSRPILWGD